MTQWLLQADIHKQMTDAIAARWEPSADTIAQLQASGAELGKMQVTGRTAVIPIDGILTQKRNWMASFFGLGNTLYPDIIAAVEQANASADVDHIELQVGTSPGGEVGGMFAAMDTIRDSGKPVEAVVDGMAASAAYGLVSQASKIIAGGRATTFGSVGVAIDTFVSDGEVSIASTKAPKKRPDLKTPEGQAVVREHLDEIHGLLAEGIAAGRKTTIEKVDADFGQGDVMLADRALKARMIDGIGTVEQSITQSATSGTKEIPKMNLETLKSEHPAVYAEAVAAGVQRGVKEERDRVAAHLTLGDASGDMETAVAAIEAGDEVTQKVIALHTAASMRRGAVAARTEDNVELDTPPPAASMDSFTAQVLALVDGSDDEDDDDAEGVING